MSLSKTHLKMNFLAEGRSHVPSPSYSLLTITYKQYCSSQKLRLTTEMAQVYLLRDRTQVVLSCPPLSCLQLTSQAERRKTFTWFMPALAKSKVGSSRGMVAEEWT